MSTVSKKIMMGSGAVDDYEIDQSAIFDKPSNTDLYRVPSSTGNRRTFTWSGWIKISDGTANQLWGTDNGDGTYFSQMSLTTAGKLDWTDYFYTSASPAIQGRLRTNRLFRDYGAWYHIVFAVDTTQATASNRFKLWINGVQETSFDTATYPSENLELYQNYANGYKTHVGDAYIDIGAASYGFNGNIAELHFFDGAAKTPSDFGETNSATGQWIPKQYTGGSYGTNGYYLKFVSGAIGTDSSGEGNNMTVTNIANGDIVTDTPTNNCMTLNSLDTGSSTLSEGNLKLVTSNHSDTSGTMRLPNTGKWYWEVTCTTVGAAYFGIYKTSYTQDSGSWINGSHIVLEASTGKKYSYPTTAATYMSGAVSNGDVVGVAVDCDNGKIFFADSNTWGDSGNPATGANPAGTFTASDGWKPGFYGPGSPNAINLSLNFGQKTFSYTPPSGFSALTASNLSSPAIALPSAQFNTVLYTGNGSTNHDITGVGFQPDWVWIKNRSQADSHVLNDAVRGAGKTIYSDLGNAEASNEAYFGPFQSDGFRLSPSSVGHAFNASSENYVSWNWKANGSGSSNSDGAISSTVSANQTAGFSIVTFTMPGSGTTTIGHGLGAVPDLIFAKSRGSAAGWITWDKSLTNSQALQLNDSAAIVSSTNIWGAAIPTSSVFGAIVGGVAPASTAAVAYCFASKDGYSSIGTYTGNGAAYGPMIVTGFRPAWLLVKRTDAANNWVIYDVKRNTFNAIDKTIYTDTADAEGSYSGGDILSNGFKVRYTGGMLNTDGGTYLYMAFAESPFKTANAR